jgi:putative sigma-54 modulation protein
MAESDVKLFLTGRHLDVTDHLRKYVDEKINKITRFFDRVNEAHVVLTQEKYRYLAEITIVAANGMSFSGSAETGDLLLSIDNTLEVLKRQVRKKKEKKFESKRHRGAEKIKAEISQREESEPYAAEFEEQPRIIKTDEYATKPMSIDEAAMQLKLGQENFIVFLNSQTNGVNVLYRLDDGNFGLIEPEF